MVYKTIKVTKEIVESHKYCDACGDEILYNLGCSLRRCCYCGDDLCDNCAISDGNSMVFCKDCWQIGEGHRSEINELEVKVKQLYDKWYGACKENVKK